MIFIPSLLCFLLGVSLVSASIKGQRVHTHNKRVTVLNAQFATDTVPSGRFILENNLWGKSAATSGSQTSQITAVNGDIISWKTNYKWTGGPSDVKSYANLDLRVGISKSLSSIKSIPAAWNWTYTSASSGLVADVSFDLWLSNVAHTGGASSSSTFEIMIWLSARGGALPAGYQIDKTTINGVTWTLYKGPVSTWTVFSFVASKEITSFKQDLKPFFTYLIKKQNVPSSQFLVQAQAGTEPFVGSATLSTTSYSISIN